MQKQKKNKTKNWLQLVIILIFFCSGPNFFFSCIPESRIDSRSIIVHFWNKKKHVELLIHPNWKFLNEICVDQSSKKVLLLLLLLLPFSHYLNHYYGSRWMIIFLFLVVVMVVVVVFVVFRDDDHKIFFFSWSPTHTHTLSHCHYRYFLWPIFKTVSLFLFLFLSAFCHLIYINIYKMNDNCIIMVNGILLNLLFIYFFFVHFISVLEFIIIMIMMTIMWNHWFGHFFFVHQSNSNSFFIIWWPNEYLFFFHFLLPYQKKIHRNIACCSIQNSNKKKFISRFFLGITTYVKIFFFSFTSLSNFSCQTKIFECWFVLKCFDKSLMWTILSIV